MRLTGIGLSLFQADVRTPIAGISSHRARDVAAGLMHDVGYGSRAHATCLTMRPPVLRTASSETCSFRGDADEVVFISHARGGSHRHVELSSEIPEVGLVRALTKAYPCNELLLTPRTVS